uniref:Uncharacterized protein n=1 Tax=Globisporangium ultimum (strain ATCC 200006 / CBS 805.95 / DAOM BR144) TaxID=431595 RepID=K3WVR0_GLOUD
MTWDDADAIYLQNSERYTQATDEFPDATMSMLLHRIQQDLGVVAGPMLRSDMRRRNLLLALFLQLVVLFDEGDDFYMKLQVPMRYKRIDFKTIVDIVIPCGSRVLTVMQGKRENLDEAVTQELTTLDIVRERSGRIGPKVGTLYGIATDFKQWVFTRQFETGEIEIDEDAINVRASLETDIEWTENRTQF